MKLIQTAGPTLVKWSRSVVSDSLQPHESQHARPPCPSPTPGVYPNPYPLSRWCHPTISPSVVPNSPALNLSQHQGLFQWVSSSHLVVKASASASVLPMNIEGWFPLGLTSLISFQFKVSQESSPTPQIKSINSSALSFLYSPTLIFIHDYWKNHCFD